MIRRSKQRVVVVSACPPHLNPGMHCVDLAWEAFVNRHGLSFETDRRALYTPRELLSVNLGSPNNFGMPFELRSMREEPCLDDAAAIVYWGDFLHSRHYRGSVSRLLEAAGIAPTPGDSAAIVDRDLYLHGAPPEVKRKAVIFGSGILTCGPDAEPMDHHETLLRDLIANCAGVWPRDMSSANRASWLRGANSGTNLGVDCALLLTPQDIARIAKQGLREHRTPTRLGVFFARTQQDLKDLLRFASALNKKLQSTPIWLNWFAGAAGSEAMRAELWPELNSPPNHSGFPDILATLLGCDAVVTDTYHVSVLAWNCGIPAICVGTGATSFQTSLSDKKKELLYLGYGLDRYYVFAEQLRGYASPASQAHSLPVDLQPPSLDELARRVSDRRAVDAIQDRIHAHRRQVESSFLDVFSSLLSKRRHAVRAAKALGSVVAHRPLRSHSPIFPTPIFVISFNRPQWVRKVLASYERLNCATTIVIHDNGSYDPEMIDLLRSLEGRGVTIYRGPRIDSVEDLNLIDNHIQDFLRSRPRPCRYVVTDCDIDVSESNPDLLGVYNELLDSFPAAQCVGPMLRIDDIPRSYPLYNQVMNRHIEQFWHKHPRWAETSFGRVAYIEAPIDTTFALHREGSRFFRLKHGLRVYYPFDARHLDWYGERGGTTYAEASSETIAHWSNDEYVREFRDEAIHHHGYQRVVRAADGSLVTESVKLSGQGRQT